MLKGPIAEGFFWLTNTEPGSGPLKPTIFMHSAAEPSPKLQTIVVEIEIYLCFYHSDPKMIQLQSITFPFIQFIYTKTIVHIPWIHKKGLLPDTHYKI